jgi:diaminohydroxyphosphoribosylaminopyrimidine deaminase/5-amino-6-(5-phosphoribosylamino)uracil reductase
VHLLHRFIEAGIWDEARVFEAPNVLSEGLLAPCLINAQKIVETNLKQDKLKVYLHQSSVFSMPQYANL